MLQWIALHVENTLGSEILSQSACELSIFKIKVKLPPNIYTRIYPLINRVQKQTYQSRFFLYLFS